MSDLQPAASQAPPRPAWWPKPAGWPDPAWPGWAALRAGRVAGGWLARLAASRGFLLTVLAIALLWPGLVVLPPLDRDEARTAQAALQMADSGDQVDIRFQDAPLYQLPPGTYWLQSAALSLFTSPAARAAGARDIWVHRLPGALAALAAVLLTSRIATVLYGTTAGFLAGLLLALSVLLGAEARQATADSPLLAVILLAQAALLEVWRRRDAAPLAPAESWIAPGLFWTAIAAGVLLKGPIILLVSGGTLLGLAIAERRVRWMLALRPAAGAVLALALVLPWAVDIAHLSGGDFFATALGGTLLATMFTARQRHGLPPGTYLLLFGLTFWPGSLFAARALPWVWSARRTPQAQFLLAWIIPSWLVFEAAVTKLPHYVLPTYPAIAILTAAALCAPPVAGQLGRLGRWLGRAWARLWVWAGLALALAGPALMLWLAPRVAALALLATVVAVVAVTQTVRQAKRQAPLLALGFATVAMLAISWSGGVLVGPALQTIWLSPRIAAAVQTHRPCPDSVLASTSYAEPSLIYLAGRTTRLIGPARAAELLHDSPACTLALVGAGESAVFLDRARALGLLPRALTHIDGIDAVTGRRLALTLFTAAAKPPAH